MWQLPSSVNTNVWSTGCLFWEAAVWLYTQRKALSIWPKWGHCESGLCARYVYHYFITCPVNHVLIFYDVQHSTAACESCPLQSILMYEVLDACFEKPLCDFTLNGNLCQFGPNGVTVKVACVPGEILTLTLILIFDLDLYLWSWLWLFVLVACFEEPLCNFKLNGKLCQFGPNGVTVKVACVPGKVAALNFDIDHLTLTFTCDLDFC